MFKALTLALCVALAGCANVGSVLGPSPEAQIATGADTVAAATTLATVALRDHKITVTSAKSYRNMLAAAGESLKDANTELEACRVQTGSTAKSMPDPCWAKVSDVVGIALSSITGVKRVLESK